MSIWSRAVSVVMQTFQTKSVLGHKLAWAASSAIGIRPTITQSSGSSSGKGTLHPGRRQSEPALGEREPVESSRNIQQKGIPSASTQPPTSQGSGGKYIDPRVLLLVLVIVILLAVCAGPGLLAEIF